MPLAFGIPSSKVDCRPRPNRRPFSHKPRWVRFGGIDVVLNSRRHQLYDPSGFAHLGIDPTARKGLIVKSTNHFNAGFKDVARGVHYVSTPGAIDPDFARIPPAGRSLRRVGTAQLRPKKWRPLRAASDTRGIRGLAGTVLKLAYARA